MLEYPLTHTSVRGSPDPIVTMMKVGRLIEMNNFCLKNFLKLSKKNLSISLKEITLAKIGKNNFFLKIIFVGSHVGRHHRKFFLHNLPRLNCNMYAKFQTSVAIGTTKKNF